MKKMRNGKETTCADKKKTQRSFCLQYEILLLGFENRIKTCNGEGCQKIFSILVGSKW